MENNLVKRSPSLVAAASAACVSAAFLAACGGGNNGFASTPMPVTPNAIAGHSASGVRHDSAIETSCPNEAEVKYHGGTIRLTLGTTDLYTTEIPSKPGITYYCIYPSRIPYEVEYKLTENENIKSVEYPARWKQDEHRDSCDGEAIHCKFTIERS